MVVVVVGGEEGGSGGVLISAFLFSWLGACLLDFVEGGNDGMVFNFGVHSCLWLRKVRADGLYDMG